MLGIVKSPVSPMKPSIRFEAKITSFNVLGENTWVWFS